ncbi:monovalent cation:proton antiporter-2 (CPA2) family protein [Flavobacterium sp. '19STA2R22 D10 B1']|uniref:monovalent cation:proton antiporter-2 (CPA2) family protein n=1 Tax=Flavobacterium aerium TaxID=3037261 RepID=UPI00278C79FE|nr:monovalent cation:proton antiporter-2 (CPA2) family protein [Flavobacterium sp. '19STA2R22 D10 B1']
MKETFLFQAMIYLAAAVIMVPIAKKMALGSVLGYLIAGILIGPFCLEFIGVEGHDIMHFAEFGVVMMLFVIGLELQPARLWKIRKTILGMGGLQVLTTTLIISSIALFFNIEWKQALALGMIVSISSTAIVMQSLHEKGLMKSEAGQSSFAVLLFQDIAVIPMLAIFPLLTNKVQVGQAVTSASNFSINAFAPWIQTLIVFASVTLVVIIGKYLVRPIFRIMAKTGMREMFTAAALLLIIGITILMSAVGLSPALGAFLAGVVLANSEYRHELESAIDPFKGLLLGLFFIAVGASIDFQLILTKPLLILGLVAGLMLIKALVLFGIGRIFKIRNAQNSIFSFGLSQIGEFAFVLLSFSSQQEILSKEITDSLIAVVAISMAFTPLIMMLNDKLILPRLCQQKKVVTIERESDIEEEDNPVIIAGYGHFGTTVGRFLRANNIGTTVLDIDSDNVDFLRRMGLKVYYGDATRFDLLEIAGAHKAQIIVIAISDEEKRLSMIETVKKHFPHLYILVRSTNRNDAYNLMNAGIMHIYRETFDTSLRLGIDALKILGHPTQAIAKSAETFFIHDERTLKYLSSIRDNDEYINAARKNIEELERIMQADREVTNENLYLNPSEEQLNLNVS